MIAEKELLELCVSLCHGQVVVDCEGQSQSDHSGTVLDDHVKYTFCELPDLHVIPDAESNGAIGRRGVANGRLNPVHAVDEALLDGEKEEGECVRANFCVGTVAERFDGGTERSDDAGQPIVCFA